MMSAEEKSADSSGNQRQSPELKSHTGAEQTGSGMSKSMHDGVEVWCDCCSCEAEPYWVEAMQQASETCLPNGTKPDIKPQDFLMKCKKS